MVLTDQEKFNTVFKCYKLYNGDYKKICHHIFISLGGATHAEIARHLVVIMPAVKKQIALEEGYKFDRNKHVTLPKIGSTNYVFDKELQTLIDPTEK